MIIAVTGGRNNNNKDVIYKILNKVNMHFPITILIHGGARGVDSICGQWAKENRIDITIFSPRWANLNKKIEPVRRKVNCHGPYNALAGFNKNKRMLKEGKPDLLVVFDGGKGTTHCTNEAFLQNIPIITQQEITTNPLWYENYHNV